MRWCYALCYVFFLFYLNFFLSGAFIHCTVLMMSDDDLFLKPSGKFGQKLFVTDRYVPSSSHLRARHRPRSCTKASHRSQSTTHKLDSLLSVYGNATFSAPMKLLLQKRQVMSQVPPHLLQYGRLVFLWTCRTFEVESYSSIPGTCHKMFLYWPFSH